MITRDQWDAMTPQQQWDLVQSLLMEVETIESAKYDEPEVLPIDASKDGKWTHAARMRGASNRYPL